jgi:hypothetical protein
LPWALPSSGNQNQEDVTNSRHLQTHKRSNQASVAKRGHPLLKTQVQKICNQTPHAVVILLFWRFFGEGPPPLSLRPCHLHWLQGTSGKYRTLYSKVPLARENVVFHAAFHRDVTMSSPSHEEEQNQNDNNNSNGPNSVNFYFIFYFINL